MIEPATRPLEWSPPRTAVSRMPYLPGSTGCGPRRRRRDGVPRQPGMAAGGFLGVEVFFVISGYLITLLIIGEHERTGSVSTRHFYLRRARRLLPALFTLLIGDHHLHHAVPARRPRTAPRRRPRRAGVRVELVPDLGRPGLHGLRRLLAAAPPLEPGGRGAVLPVVAARDDRPDPSRPAPAAGDEPLAVPRRHRRHGPRWRCSTTRARSRAARRRPTPTGRSPGVASPRPTRCTSPRRPGRRACCSARRSPWCGDPSP